MYLDSRGIPLSKYNIPVGRIPLCTSLVWMKEPVCFLFPTSPLTSWNKIVIFGHLLFRFGKSTVRKPVHSVICSSWPHASLLSNAHCKWSSPLRLTNCNLFHSIVPKPCVSILLDLEEWSWFPKSLSWKWMHLKNVSLTVVNVGRQIQETILVFQHLLEVHIWKYRADLGKQMT